MIPLRKRPILRSGRSEHQTADLGHGRAGAAAIKTSPAAMGGRDILQEATALRETGCMVCGPLLQTEFRRLLSDEVVMILPAVWLFSFCR